MRYEGGQYYVKSEEEMRALFPYAAQAIENTQKIADRCHVEIEFGVTKLPHFTVPDGYDSWTYLNKLCHEGLIQRYPDRHDELLPQLDYELSVIQKMGSVSYTHLAELRDEFNTKKAQWENEKKSVEKVQKLREEIEAVKNEIKMAQQKYDLEKAAELQYGKLPQLQKQLEIEEEAVKKRDLSLVHENVSEEEIARIISRWTGIPVAKLTESERNKTLHLDEELHKRVIGQDEGVTKVTEAIIRSKAGIKDPSKPIGSFLFLGPTGVGKTELAKALAASLFDDESNICLLYTSGNL